MKNTLEVKGVEQWFNTKYLRMSLINKIEDDFSKCSTIKGAMNESLETLARQIAVGKVAVESNLGNLHEVNIDSPTHDKLKAKFFDLMVKGLNE